MPDIEACIKLNSGAQCTNTISDNTRTISESDWEEIKVGRISQTVEDWSKIKTFILKSCEINKACKIKSVKKRIELMEEQFCLDCR